MARKLKGKSRPLAVGEIEVQLQTVGAHLGAMIRYEAEAAAAATGTAIDLEGTNAAARSFNMELQSFLSAGRTARNYLQKAAKGAGERDWLSERLSERLFEFHHCLADQYLHNYPVEPGVHQTVRYEAERGTPVVQTAFGRVPRQMTIVGFEGLSYRYEPKNLEPEIGRLLEGLLREYGTNGIIELAGRYYDGLGQVLKSGIRRGRFDKTS
jgi:hypothetical protein